jgi:hypothetical protein
LQVDPDKQIVGVVVMPKKGAEAAAEEGAESDPPRQWAGVFRWDIAGYNDPGDLEAYLLTQVNMAPGQARVEAVWTYEGRKLRTAVNAGMKVQIAIIAWRAAGFEVRLV